MLLANQQRSIFVISRLLDKLPLLTAGKLGACLSHRETSPRLKFIGIIDKRENNIYIEYLSNFGDVKQQMVCIIFFENIHGKCPLL